ncbi:MAG: UrcA family protein [Sphingomonadales bacterium]|jgi:UrcA family protein|nr:UrcA family protein [Sphingomonadales bacterium]MBK9004482.1 UrcA family protein [Sphingomonadales bacterium]MBK9269668.1 UrcA family protein [Sphingomonadales bacterium]MBP6434240.1 UrcA family protein [Sphingorhabdus sp.]
MARYRLTSLVAAATIATLAAPSLSAAERQRNVEYHDLDLSTEAGQAKFKARIMRAVRNVCASPSAKSLVDRKDQLQCEARAKISAMAKAAKTIARYGSNVKIALD